MKWPATETELKAAGYKFAGMKRCRGPICRDIIEWVTTPKGKRMPLSATLSGETYEPHWAGCPDAQRYKSTRTKGQR